MSKKNKKQKPHEENHSIKPIVFVGAAFLVILSLIGVGIWFGTRSTTTQVTDSNSLSTEDGKQVVNITAKNGYNPNFVVAKANQETILKMTTKNSYDCSSVFYIKALNISKTLPASGNTVINIPPQSSGTILQGVCSMGMYQFKIKFI